VIVDAQLAVTTELPYISKVFFFNFLNKLANIMKLLKIEDNETETWLRLVNQDFICKTVLKTIKKIPNRAGEYLTDVVNLAVEEMKIGELTPSDLLDIINTHHGYNIKSQSINRLMKKDGEINNDIPLLTTPLLIYLFSIPWKL